MCIRDSRKGLHTWHIGKTDSHDDRKGGAKLEFPEADEWEKLEQGTDLSLIHI